MCPLTLWLRYLSFIVLLSKLFGYHCHFFLVLWMLLSLLFQVNSILIRRRQWHPTPVLLPRKSHGRRSRQSVGSQRVGHDWVTSLSLFTFMHWRRRWQPTPLFVPGESEGWGSLVGFRQWGRTVGHDWSDLAAAAVLITCTEYSILCESFPSFNFKSS